MKAIEIPKRLADAVESVRTIVQQSRTPRRAVLRPDQPYRDALDRFAVAYLDVARMDGSPAIYQTVRLDKAGQELERVRPDTLVTLQSALKHDIDARVATKELRGDMRFGALASAIERERAALLDPNVRAHRFVSRWNAEMRTLDAVSEDYRRFKECEHVERKLTGFVKELDADKPMMTAMQADPARFELDAGSPLAQALRETLPAHALQVGIAYGFASPSRGFSR